MTTILLYVLTVLIWGSTWIMMKFQLGVVAPSASLSYRYLIAGGLVLYREWAETSTAQVFAFLAGTTATVAAVSSRLPS